VLLGRAVEQRVESGLQRQNKEADFKQRRIESGGHPWWHRVDHTWRFLGVHPWEARSQDVDGLKGWGGKKAP
jgi:hypothetical protein